jgi:hypothetical protein
MNFQPLCFVLLAVLAFSCNSGETEKSFEETPDTISRQSKKPVAPETPSVPVKKDTAQQPGTRTYANQRFREVAVEKLSGSRYRVKGEAQIFEANFSWVVEDGHEELKNGHEMTDAGAPEWGNFDFTIDVPKSRPNSTLTLILFEISAKDGSRQHELPIKLE